MTILLRGALESPPNCYAPAWRVGERWVAARERLLRIASAVDEDSADTLELACFVVDEALSVAALNEDSSYVPMFEEVATVVFSRLPDPKISAIVCGELQRLAIRD